MTGPSIPAPCTKGCADCPCRRAADRLKESRNG
ncbi:hypothetical protein SAMN05421539_101874 [Jannaschia seohaensis]|uniref:Uncharacterized protein n=1 Tax=Jannaschia seohaensis TaxID=475081 RepID=A0A2Y9A5L0_9RHOB|nr:hypothetical protein BCF38_101874 [Jannaschia seohaensis]SSA38738.1 hypothetical protein SAMN05421539_101874 [Jannaschia seohaensis]